MDLLFSDDFRELEILRLNFGVVASVVLDERIRCDGVIFVIVVVRVRVLEHHAVAPAKQVFVANATGFLYDMRRVMRNRCSIVR